MILTTFERDEYVYEALAVGRQRPFPLKNAPPEELLHAVHIVTARRALLGPSVTRRIIDSSPATGPRPSSARGWTLSQREHEC